MDEVDRDESKTRLLKLEIVNPWEKRCEVLFFAPKWKRNHPNPQIKAVSIRTDRGF